MRCTTFRALGEGAVEHLENQEMFALLGIRCKDGCTQSVGAFLHRLRFGSPAPKRVPTWQWWTSRIRFLTAASCPVSPLVPNRDTHAHTAQQATPTPQEKNQDGHRYSHLLESAKSKQRPYTRRGRQRGKQASRLPAPPPAHPNSPNIFCLENKKIVKFPGWEYWDRSIVWLKIE